MKRVTHLFLTITLNVAALATLNLWMMSNSGYVIAGCRIGMRSTTLRIDQHGWKLENGVYPIR